VTMAAALEGADAASRNEAAQQSVEMIVSALGESESGSSASRGSQTQRW